MESPLPPIIKASLNAREEALIPSYDNKSSGLFFTSVDMPVPPYPGETTDEESPRHYVPEHPDTTPVGRGLPQHRAQYRQALLQFKARLSDIKGALLGLHGTLRARAKPIQSLLILYAFSLSFCCLFCTFIYATLIKTHLETPGVFWDAVKTNYLVGVASQFSAILTAATVKALLGALKRAFLLRRGGVNFASWVGLGGSDWWSVFQVAVVSGGLDLWCDIRVLLPFMNLAFGSIVKFNADFDFFFRASNIQIPVYSGLIKPDVDVMYMVPAADTAMYFSTWSASLLTNSMFATDLAFPLDNFTCTEHSGCRAVMMPGGLTMARQAKKHLNESIRFSDVFWGNIDTVRIDNGTGMIVKFETPDPSAVVFNTTECVYAGEQVKNGVQVCLRQVNDSILVGWSACPKDLYDTNACTTNPSWRSLPLNSSTLMSLYTIQTTTSYSLSSQRIINIVPLSPAPTPIPLSTNEYFRILNRILIPPSSPPVNATQTQLRDFNRDTHNINSLIDAIAWMHRTFLKSFPSDRTSATSMLQNILSVPVQFSMTARTYANYTVVERGLQEHVQFPLPESMRTVATGGWSRQRLKILPWAGALFIGVDLAVHLAVGVGIVWILWVRKDREVALPDEVGVKELEDVREARRVRVEGAAEEDEEQGKWRWFVSWLGWLVKGRWKRVRRGLHGGDVEKGEVAVPLLDFPLMQDEKEEEEDSVSRMAWKYRTARMVGQKEDVGT
ncbi:hypothetical protein QBC44DRAFT_328316 [Cladorrhinum sp. PSN332]|nr:hypothetical protein QBC44DRAFT_328316 [Cladorrhinum sp. PSN332]